MNIDARAEQAVAARRKARCHEHRLVAGTADLEGQQEQAQGRPLRRDDLFGGHVAGLADLLAKLG
ncbi:hypothetical protein D9M68_858680 [compost metagenome]